jgi:iron complex outermembrane receptor protein/hemoglobin/transferrin/lactoferrin receptor protein
LVDVVDVRITRALSRGQYVDGARYLLLGGFAEADLAAWRWLRVRAGARLAHSAADVPADVESRSAAIDRGFTQPVGRVGLEIIPATGFSLLANIDQGFRAPNLDDLTSRQQAGPGFQFENPDLRPERSTTWELGARLRRPRVEAEAWAYATQIDDAITRAIRMGSECPPMTPSCANAFSRFRLVNAPGTTWVFGAEAVVRAQLHETLLLSLTWAWAWGEGPDPSMQWVAMHLERGEAAEELAARERACDVADEGLAIECDAALGAPIQIRQRAEVLQ